MTWFHLTRSCCLLSSFYSPLKLPLEADHWTKYEQAFHRAHRSVKMMPQTPWNGLVSSTHHCVFLVLVFLLPLSCCACQAGVILLVRRLVAEETVLVVLQAQAIWDPGSFCLVWRSCLVVPSVLGLWCYALLQREQHRRILLAHSSSAEVTTLVWRILHSRKPLTDHFMQFSRIWAIIIIFLFNFAFRIILLEKRRACNFMLHD